MKGILYFAILLILFSGCQTNAQTVDDTKPPHDGREDGAVLADTIAFSTGDWWSENQNSIVVEFPFEQSSPIAQFAGRAVKSEVEAADYADAILENEKQSGFFGTYELKSIYKDTKGDVWIFAYSERELLPGSVLYAVVNGKNSEVMQMWVE